MSIATNLVLRLCILMMTVIIPEYSIISVHLEPPITKIYEVLPRFSVMAIKAWKDNIGNYSMESIGAINWDNMNF